MLTLADFIAKGFCRVEGEQLIAGFKLDRRQPGPGRVRVITDVINLEQRTIADCDFTWGHCNPGLYRQENQVVVNGENNVLFDVQQISVQPAQLVNVHAVVCGQIFNQSGDRLASRFAAV